MDRGKDMYKNTFFHMCVYKKLVENVKMNILLCNALHNKMFIFFWRARAQSGLDASLIISVAGVESNLSKITQLCTNVGCYITRCLPLQGPLGGFMPRTKNRPSKIHNYFTILGLSDELGVIFFLNRL